MLNIVRAWKDAEYREALSADELVGIPEHPAGLITLTDAELDSIAGGVPYWSCHRNYCWSWDSCSTLPIKQCFTGGIANSDAFVEDFVVLGGIGFLDSDEKVSQEECDMILKAVNEWEKDPTLTPEQLEGIRLVTDNMKEQLSTDEWESLDKSISNLQERGALTPEEVHSIAEFATKLSEQG